MLRNLIWLHTRLSFSYIILVRKLTKRSHCLTGLEQEIRLLVDFFSFKLRLPLSDTFYYIQTRKLLNNEHNFIKQISRSIIRESDEKFLLRYFLLKKLLLLRMWSGRRPHLKRLALDNYRHNKYWETYSML